MIYEIPEIRGPKEAALSRIDELRRQLRFYVAEPRRWVGSVRRVLGARAIRGSNSIEGFNVSVEDALAAIEGEEPSEASPETDWLAVLGYRRCDDLCASACHTMTTLHSPSWFEACIS